METSRRQASIIFERIQKYFKPHIPARYQIQVVNNKFDKKYNFFFVVSKPKRMTRSIPLRTIREQDLVYLEAIVTELKKLIKLTIKFIGFDDQRWESNGKLIK
ncbi:hypothetical protein [Liquorilactobacillus satsumensis]|uniref:hypothetical protein n=1 Tax=Liquorilactobacillus satsumensis TaxID=259059 RepID=UPI0039EB798F